MPKPRANIRLSHKAHALLEEMTRAPGVHKSAIMEAAFWAYVDPEKNSGHEQSVMRRFDSIETRLNAIECDASLSVETLGQFILYWLIRTEPLPDGEREAAHKLGQRRFDYFIEQVAKKVGSNGGLTARVFPSLGDDEATL